MSSEYIGGVSCLMVQRPPLQVSETPSPAQAEKQQAVAAAAVAAGFSEGDLHDLKAMMTAMKGARLSQVGHKRTYTLKPDYRALAQPRGGVDEPVRLRRKI